MRIRQQLSGNSTNKILYHSIAENKIIINLCLQQSEFHSL